MANTKVDQKTEEDNGLLGFSNPNYQLDDAVNCNTASDDGLYDELYEELDSVCNFRRGPSVKNRRGYASLDLNSMGIDLTAGPATTTTTTTTTGSSVLLGNHTLQTPNGGTNRNTALESELHDNNFPDNEKVSNMGRTDNGLLDYYLHYDQVSGNHRSRPDLLETTTGTQPPHNPADSDVRGMDINSPDSNDSGIQENNPLLIPHVAGQLTNELYALPVKRKVASPAAAAAAAAEEGVSTDDKTIPTDKEEEGDAQTRGDRGEEEQREEKEEILPLGWEKHEDNDGPYYWHIKSGTIQRDPPPPAPPSLLKETKKTPSHPGEPLIPVSSLATNLIASVPLCTSSAEGVPTVAVASSAGTVITENESSPKLENDLNRRGSLKDTCIEREKPIRFAVRSLGWVEIAEDDLTPERSSKAVNKCIVDLSLGRNDILDVVGRWGDGKDLYMDLDDSSLKLVDPENFTVLNTQPIHTIRVWGVGRDNGRDFAYVARDRASRKHMCHVFRCDTPARTIANTLRDTCKKIMLERSLSQNLGRHIDGGSSSQRNGSMGRSGLARPTNLPTEHRRFHHRMPHTSYSAQSFPTPMEEPKKVLKVRYVGVVQVSRNMGMDVLNQAIDHLTSINPMDQWQYVNVAVAPSTITVSEQRGEGRQIAECRVRYLSFLGIGTNVKHCAFIMHSAQDEFMAYVFYCEPSSGALCKTIEAACKLRYQKCLDAHRQGLDMRSADSQSNRGFGAALKNMLGSLTGRKARSTES